MSGVVCPRCGCPYLDDINDKSLGRAPMKCEYCEWTGDTSGLPYETNDDEFYSEWHATITLRRKGLILRVTCDERINPRVTTDVMRLFGIDQITSTRLDEHTILIPLILKQVPSAEQRQKLKDIPGVISIS